MRSVSRHYRAACLLSRYSQRSALSLMKNRMILSVVTCAFLALTYLARAASSVALSANDWPAWRGPTRDGIAAPGQNPPVQWSETNGVLWKAPIAGRGHGSPIVVGDRIYLATADRAKLSQSVLCLDRHTGKLVWQAEVHGSSAEPGKHSNSSAASSTVAAASLWDSTARLAALSGANRAQKLRTTLRRPSCAQVAAPKW